MSVTGLTSNPTIFDHAIAHSEAYDESIRKLIARGQTGEALLFDLALEDLTRAADLFLPIHQATDGVDGWVSLEVAPQLAYEILSVFLDTPFEGGRHTRRLEEIAVIEQEECGH